MKSSTSVIALVAAIAPFALAAPLAQHIDYVTDTAVVTAFAQVTVTEGAGAPAPAATTTTAAAQSSPAAHKADHNGNGGHKQSWSWTHTEEASSATQTTIWSAPSAFSAPPVTTQAPPPPPPPETSAPPPPPQTQAPPPPPASSAAPAPSSGNTPSGNPSASGDSSYKDGGDIAAVQVAKHNEWRAKFQASPVSWNQSLVQEALDSLAKPEFQCQMSHSNVGQNLAQKYAGSGDATDAWAKEFSKYPWNAPDFTEDSGHFSQVVWQDTQSIGCAAHQCENGWWNLICNYYPVGNMLGDFAKNVKPQA